MVIQTQNVKKSGYLGILNGLVLGNFMSFLVGNHILGISNLRIFNFPFILIFSLFVFFVYKHAHLKVYKKMKSVLPEIPLDSNLRVTIKQFFEIVVLNK